MVIQAMAIKIATAIKTTAAVAVTVAVAEVVASPPSSLTVIAIL